MLSSVKSYVICTTARSGSNLFCSFLRNTKVLGHPIEAFNPDTIRSSGFGIEHANEESLSLSLYIDWLMARRRTKNGVFGTKLLYEDFDSFKGFSRFSAMMEGSVLLHLRRRSKLRQAISYYFAEMTGQWVASDQAIMDPNEVPFDFDRIEANLQRLIVQDSTWSALLDGTGLSYKEIYFEDFIKKPRSTINDIMSLLELPSADVPVSSEMREQSNSKTKDFYKMFCDELRGRLFQPKKEQNYKKLKFIP